MYTTFEETLEKTGVLTFTNVGQSMLPLIREGRDVMQIRRCDASRLKKYDAVLFRREGVQGRGKYVMHRILKRTPDGLFWIVGDNCTEGETVSGGQILGVLFAITKGKKTVRVTDLSYRAYVAFWCAPYHTRFAVLKFLRFMRSNSRKAKRLFARILKKSGGEKK